MEIGQITQKRIRLQYVGTCQVCGAGLAAHQMAYYEPPTKTVRCLDCPADAASAGDGGLASLDDEPVPASGVAGASARRKYERGMRKHEEDTRAKHPRIGGLLFALRGEPQSTRAWRLGAEGEEELGARLDRHVGPALAVLHDRAVPDSKSNIDHIAVTPSGVWVIDAKHCEGRPELRTEGGLFRARMERLFVGGRDRTKLVDGMLRQLAIVRNVLVDDVAVTCVLCFVDADWPLFLRFFTTRGVHVVSPRRLQKILDDGAKGPVDVPTTCRLLAMRFPPR